MSSVSLQILLLEAYEQLEVSVAAEIDKALAKQAEELKAAQRRVEFLTSRVEEEREVTRQLRDHQSNLEDQVKDALMRNRQYEGGIYGLPQVMREHAYKQKLVLPWALNPGHNIILDDLCHLVLAMQAVEEIHQLKEGVYKEQARVRELVQQINKLTAKVEDLHDENTVLRQKCNLGDGDRVDIKDVRMQKEAAITQLRSLNALLERQVGLAKVCSGSYPLVLLF